MKTLVLQSGSLQSQESNLDCGGVVFQISGKSVPAIREGGVFDLLSGVELINSNTRVRGTSAPKACRHRSVRLPQDLSIC